MTTPAPLRRGALIVLAGLLVGVVAACSSPSATPGGSRATVENGTVEITADEIAFDVGLIEAPAGEAFTIVLVNMEEVSHNVSVYTERDGEEVVTGDFITGPDETVEIEVPALDAGEYFFVCDLHPDQMSGTLIVE